jgi:hypothetical protein
VDVDVVIVVVAVVEVAVVEVLVLVQAMPHIAGQCFLAKASPSVSSVEVDAAMQSAFTTLVPHTTASATPLHDCGL